MRFLYKFWPYILLIVIVSLFYYPIIFFGRIPVPTDAMVGLYHPWRDIYSETNPRGIAFKNFLITDPFRQIIPWRKLAIDQWKSGTPSWNPYAFSGMPFDVNVQSGSYYPLNIFFFITDFLIAWNILILSQQFIAVVGMYLFLKNKLFSYDESIFGAIIWGFCGFMIAWLTWGTMDQIASWLPSALFLVDKILVRKILNIKTAMWLLFLVFCLVCIGTGGHVQISLYVAGLIFVYTLSKSFSDRKSTLVKILLSLSFILPLIILLLIYRPIIGFLNEATRTTIESNWNNPGWFMPWQNLVQFVAPDFFGNPATLNYWGIWNYGEFIGYIGIVPLIFAVYSTFFTPFKKYLLWKLNLFMLFLMIFPSPIANLPFIYKIPLLSALQPTRLMVLIDFTLIILSVYGFREFKQNKSITRPVASVGIIFLILSILIIVEKKYGLLLFTQQNLAVAKNNLILPALTYLSFIFLIYVRRYFRRKIYPGIIYSSVIILVIFDLFRFGWKFTPFTDPKYFFPTTKIISFLSKETPPFRVMAMDERIFPPNVNIYYGLESVSGYDPLYSTRYAEFITAMERGKPDITPPFGFNRIITPKNIDSPLFKLLNVKYIMSFDTLNPLKYSLILKEGETNVYQNIDLISRLIIVKKYYVISDKNEIFSKLYSSTFNPTSEIILESDPNIQLSSLTVDESAKIAKYSDNEITIKTITTDQRLIYLGNIYSPGWKIFIDGKSDKIFRANYIFSAFIAPKGNHTVTIKYN
jgi:hypothetical protein